MEQKPGNSQPTSIGMDNQNAASTPSIILWVTCIIAVVFTGFLFMSSRSYSNAVDEKSQAKNALDSELAGSNYTKIEQQANSFKEAFTILSDISSTRKPKKDVLAELYATFTKDITLKNIAISDGSLSVDGNTASYRAVADFMVGLKENKKISEVKLASAAVNTDEAAPANQKVTFSVTAKIDLKKDAPVVSPVAADNSSVETLNSGNNTAPTDSSIDSLGL